MQSSRMDKQIRIDYPTTSKDGYGAAVINWTELATVWAEVQDAVPSRSEAVKQGLATATRQTRVRFRFRSDVTSAMRIVVLDTPSRTLAIVGGPAELGRREVSEVMCEEYRP